MIQVGLFAALAALGALVQLAASGARFSHLGGAVVFPVGVALFFAVEVLLLMCGVPLSMTAVTVTWSVLAVASAALVAARRRSLDRAAILRAVGWTVGFAGLATLIAAFNYTTTSPDSFHFILTGQLLGPDGGLSDVVWDRLGKRGVFLSAVHAQGPLIGVDFLYAFAPTLTASFLMVLAVALGRTLDREARSGAAVAAIGLALATLTTTYVFTFHAFYVHTNMASAGFLLGMVVTFWFAARDQDASLLVSSAACGVGLVLQRIETPYTALLFAVLLLHESGRLPRRALLAWLTSFSLVAVAWSAVLIAHVGRTYYVTPGRTALLAVGAVGVGVYALAVSRDMWPKLRARVPLLLVVLGLLALAAGATRDFASLSSSIQVTSENVFAPEEWSWGHAPVALILMAMLALLMPRPPGAAVFVYGIPLYILYVILLAIPSPYRFGWGDSGNRLLLHALPLSFFYVTARVLPAFRPGPRP